MAENRGKTLYCGIDQSDTFAKAETWEAGKDRNERDDTIYSGERGIFRGFIAAQEGWLTEGESGVTGVSIDRIFEFPKEERRRTKRVKRLRIASEGNCPDPEDGRDPGTLACSPWAARHVSNPFASGNPSKRNAQGTYANQSGPALDWAINWQTQDLYNPQNSNILGSVSPSTEGWTALAAAAAKEVCRAEGYPSVTNVVFGPGHSDDQNPGGYARTNRGPGLGWFFDNHDGADYKYRARQSRTWTATCKKTVRRSRK